jgi:flavin reductase (DIM6/NTAB) family NADH-FMN oxidoreductase RutF/predicted ester cyclase
MRDFKNAVRSAWISAWDHGDVDALDDIMDPNYVLENADSGAKGSLADLKQEALDVRAAFPDLRTTIEKIVVDGNDFAIFWTTSGTFQNALRDVPPTGEQVQTRGSIQGIRKGDRIVGERVTWNLGNLLADAGAPSLRSALESDVGRSRSAGALGLPSNDALKDFNRRFVTGVTVVGTTNSAGRPVGLAANSYASVSLDPPLVLVCVQKTALTYPALFQSNYLGISILGNTQRAVVDVFASKTADKFAHVNWHMGPQGSPLIDSSAAHIEAEIKERLQAKTHTVFIARVTYVNASDISPMVYKAGAFYDGDSLVRL